MSCNVFCCYSQRTCHILAQCTRSCRICCHQSRSQRQYLAQKKKFYGFSLTKAPNDGNKIIHSQGHAKAFGRSKWNCKSTIPCHGNTSLTKNALSRSRSLWLAISCVLCVMIYVEFYPNKLAAFIENHPQHGFDADYPWTYSLATLIELVKKARVFVRTANTSELIMDWFNCCIIQVYAGHYQRSKQKLLSSADFRF